MYIIFNQFNGYTIQIGWGKVSGNCYIPTNNIPTYNYNIDEYYISQESYQYYYPFCSDYTISFFS